MEIKVTKNYLEEFFDNLELEYNFIRYMDDGDPLYAVNIENRGFNISLSEESSILMMLSTKIIRSNEKITLDIINEINKKSDYPVCLIENKGIQAIHMKHNIMFGKGVSEDSIILELGSFLFCTCDVEHLLKEHISDEILFIPIGLDSEE